MTDGKRKRLVGLAIFLLFLLSSLVIQYYYLQVIEGEKWAKRAEKQHYFTITEVPKRGKFISNTSLKSNHPIKPVSFVEDIEKYHLHIDPISIPEQHRDNVANQVVQITRPSLAIELKLRGQFARKSRDRRLLMWLDRNVRNEIREWWHQYARKHKIAKNALFFVRDYQRSYPFGQLLGQVLQTVQNHKDEKTHQSIPTGGLELTMNPFLVGKQGKRRLMRSTRNAFETGEVIMEPLHGADVYLTINHVLQAISEQELEKGVLACKAKGGWAVMMQPYTGEILAMAHYPFFHPHEYQSYYSDPERIDAIRIKAISDAFEPGSIMKPITLAIALHANHVLIASGKPPLFDPEAKMVTSNSHFPGRKKELRDGRLHSFLNIDMALQKSSNIYVARLNQLIIERLGVAWCRSALHDLFGIGVRTGIELPGETPGVLPMPGRKHANGTLEWSAGTPYTLAIGHNLQMNCLQILRGYSVIANGGYLVTPTIVRKMVRTQANKTEEVVADFTDRYLEFPRVIDSSVSNRVKRAMRFVTKYGGTSPKADIYGYTEAGKSGTANKVNEAEGGYSDRKYVASFVGFAPASKPEFVLIISMDEPEYGYLPGIGKTHHGGVCAAPVFREIATRALAYLGTEEDDPHGYPADDPRYKKGQVEWSEEIQLLKDKYETWNK